MTTKTLRVDMNEIEEAIEFGSDVYRHVLDTESGKCIALPGDAFPADVDDEMQAALDMVEEAPAGRYLSLDPEDFRLSTHDHRRFADTVSDEAFRNRLREALAMRRGAFRTFLDVLHGEAGELDRWRHFERQRLRENIVEFLAEEGINVLYEPLPPYQQRLAERQHLLDGAAKFVERVKHIRGVVRIALIGSLTTPKPQPNNVNLLVTIATEEIVPEIAAAARKLSGYAQTMNRGADVLLADASGTYLGRTCPWRECRPGIRSRCQAQHCGGHLYDDLHIVTLPKKLIASPPLVIWPKPAVSGDMPADTLQAFGIVR
jgi:hypothetical protein